MSSRYNEVDEVDEVVEVIVVVVVCCVGKKRWNCSFSTEKKRKVPPPKIEGNKLKSSEYVPSLSL